MTMEYLDKSVRLRTPLARARKYLCGAGQNYAKGKSLATAWRHCRVGSWMAWWLHEWRGVSAEELREVLPTVGYEGPMRFVDWDVEGRSIDQPPFAKALRRAYNPDGTRKGA
jgi:hypothetical protein